MKVFFTILFYVFLTTLTIGIGAEEKAAPEKKKEVIEDKKPILGYNAKFRSLSFSFGNSLFSPTGSLLSTEKGYDRLLMLKVFNGNIANSVYGSGAFYHQPNYEGAGPVNILYEMGYSDNISIGVNFSYYSIIAKRQRIAKELLAYGQIITAPKEMSIYQEFSPEAVVTYHFFTNQALDPYVRGSLGLIFAGGDSIHRDIYENYLRTSDDLTNGRGFSYGFGGGANYHFNSYLYTFFEGNFKFRHIMADQFSTYRTLRSFTFNIGVGINFSDVYY